MAGMSVTEERLYRINFSKAYFKTGQMVLVANKPVLQHLDNFPALRAQVVSLRVGVVENTTGEIYVMENLNMARKVVRRASTITTCSCAMMVVPRLVSSLVLTGLYGQLVSVEIQLSFMPRGAEQAPRDDS